MSNNKIEPKNRDLNNQDYSKLEIITWIKKNLNSLVFLSDLNLPTHLLTFLIDLWHCNNDDDNPKEISGTTYFNNFYSHHHIPYKKKTHSHLALLSLFGKKKKKGKAR